MIKTLYIKNLAIIKEIKVEFSAHLNIITGETGAGKSIIINAINIILGGRFKRNMIRTNEDICVIEGVFNSKSTKCVIRRIYNKTGASKSYFNEEPITLDELKIKTSFLVDLHGQHDHQKLLDNDYHIKYLDAFGSYTKELKEIKTTYNELEKIERKLLDQQNKEKEIKNNVELYKFQLKDLSAISLYKDLDREIELEYRKLNNSQTIYDRLSDLVDNLDNNNESIIKKFNHHYNSILKFSDLSKNLNNIISRINSIQIDLQDFSSELNQYITNIDINSDGLIIIDEKLEYLEMLKRKYGGSLENVMKYKNEISTFLSNNQNIKTDIKKLKEKYSELIKKYFKQSKSLTKKRKNNSIIFMGKITDILKNLDMVDTRIKISIKSKTKEVRSEDGQDTCQIDISPNIGEELRPLNKIASGGELSRIMLAIKLLMQEKDPVETIIFDEVDSGISGKTAENIGILLEQLGLARQIICITHLSQIASKGKNHYKVNKISDNKRTAVNIEKLSKKKRILEIASLISGSKITETGKQQAEELLIG